MSSFTKAEKALSRGDNETAKSEISKIKATELNDDGKGKFDSFRHSLRVDPYVFGVGLFGIALLSIIVFLTYSR